LKKYFILILNIKKIYIISSYCFFITFQYALIKEDLITNLVNCSKYLKQKKGERESVRKLLMSKINLIDIRFGQLLGHHQ